jgi:hypothetical protein
MSKRFRTLDSKISFFAFADIITAVSGMLIFITLLLATDLGKPVDDRSQSARSELEQQLEDTLAQQVEADSQNQRLQELLAIAETAPDAEKLQADIAKLRAQLSEEQQKQAVLADQMSGSQAAIAARDKVLGLTDLKTKIQGAIQDAESIGRQESSARSELAKWEQQVANTQSQLLKLRAFEGHLWLIPEQSKTAKEPVIVTVNEKGIIVERFDKPALKKEFSNAESASGLKDYLQGLKPLNQYVVFYLKPSGIALFQKLVQIGRDKGFEVGFDALAENQTIDFSPPPRLDEPPIPPVASGGEPGGNAPGQSRPAASSRPASPTPPPAAAAATPPKSNVPPPATASPPAPPKAKSWWQRFLEWIGIR